MSLGDKITDFLYNVERVETPEEPFEARVEAEIEQAFFHIQRLNAAVAQVADEIDRLRREIAKPS